MIIECFFIILYLIWPGSASRRLCSPKMIDRSTIALLLLLLLVELEKFLWLLELAFNFVTSLLVILWQHPWTCC